MPDIIIVGAGTAGLTAAIYARRAAKEVLVLEALSYGGQIINTPEIQNFPTAPGISGFDYATKLYDQAKALGAEIRFEKVTEVRDLGEEKEVVTPKNTYRARAVILATGSENRKLGVADEDKLVGRGVSYCATCDGPFYRNQEIAVVGGGNTAIQEALHLTRFAKKITVIHRRSELRATKILQERAFAEEKIEFVWNTQVKAVQGGKSGVESLLLSGEGGAEQVLPVTGVFMFIGIQPNNELLPLEVLEHDQAGFLHTDEAMATALPGVFAAGDIRSKKFRQIVNAASDGAVAALSAGHYLEQHFPNTSDKSS